MYVSDRIDRDAIGFASAIASIDNVYALHIFWHIWRERRILFNAFLTLSWKEGLEDLPQIIDFAKNCRTLMSLTILRSWQRTYNLVALNILTDAERRSIFEKQPKQFVNQLVEAIKVN